MNTMSGVGNTVNSKAPFSLVFASYPHTPAAGILANAKYAYH
jgi:hypothetical protein